MRSKLGTSLIAIISVIVAFSHHKCRRRRSHRHHHRLSCTILNTLKAHSFVRATENFSHILNYRELICLRHEAAKCLNFWCCKSHGHIFQSYLFDEFYGRLYIKSLYLGFFGIQRYRIVISVV